MHVQISYLHILLIIAYQCWLATGTFARPRWVMCNTMPLLADTGFLVSLLTVFIFSHLVTAEPSFHLTLERRGGSLATKIEVNITQLAQLAHHAESRYIRSDRAIEGNKVVRRWKDQNSDLVDGSDLMSNIGQNGSW